MPPRRPWFGCGNDVTDAHAFLYQMDHHVPDDPHWYHLVLPMVKWEVQDDEGRGKGLGVVFLGYNDSWTCSERAVFEWYGN